MDTSNSSPGNEDIISILESMSDAFCAVDKQWRLIYVNGRAEQITHRSRADLLGKLIWDAFPESIGSAFYEHYHLKSAEGLRLRLEVFCPPLQAWLEVNAMPSPLGLAFYFRDVTKQRRSTGDLEHLAEQIFSQHAYLETLLRHIPAGVIISEAPSGRVLFGNERMEELLGHPVVPPKNVAEYGVWRGFHPERPAVRSARVASGPRHHHRGSHQRRRNPHRETRWQEVGAAGFRSPHPQSAWDHSGGHRRRAGHHRASADGRRAEKQCATGAAGAPRKAEPPTNSRTNSLRWYRTNCVRRSRRWS
jgi:PAS domain S-box-containing protein